MKTQLTEDDILKYLTDDSKCPYCSSDNISVVDYGIDTHDVTCKDCSAEWREVLSIIDIIEINPPKIN